MFSPEIYLCFVHLFTGFHQNTILRFFSVTFPSLTDSFQWPKKASLFGHNAFLSHTKMSKTKKWQTVLSCFGQMTEISQRTRERTPTPSLLTKKHTKNAALKSKTRAAAELQRSTQATHTLKSLEHNLELKTRERTTNSEKQRSRSDAKPRTPFTFRSGTEHGQTMQCQWTPTVPARIPPCAAVFTAAGSTINRKIKP